MVASIRLRIIRVKLWRMYLRSLSELGVRLGSYRGTSFGACNHVGTFRSDHSRACICAHHVRCSHMLLSYFRWITILKHNSVITGGYLILAHIHSTPYQTWISIMAASNLFHSKLLGLTAFLLSSLVHLLAVRTVQDSLLDWTVVGLSQVGSLVHNYFFRILVNNSVDWHGVGLVANDDLLWHFNVVVWVVLYIVNYSSCRTHTTALVRSPVCKLRSNIKSVSSLATQYVVRNIFDRSWLLVPITSTDNIGVLLGVSSSTCILRIEVVRRIGVNY
jgi:hypothetical protein